MVSWPMDIQPDGAFLFDMDGTLVDSTSVVEQLWLDWSDSHGLDYSSIIAVAHGRRDVDVIQEVAPWLDAEEEAIWILNEELKRTHGLKAVPGAARLLSNLDPAKWAVVTSASDELARMRLGAANLPVPPVLVSAEDVSVGKPDPQGYLLAAARLGCDIRHSIVFEDTVAGLTAGSVAGASAVLVKATAAARTIEWPASIRDFRDDRLRLSRKL